MTDFNEEERRNLATKGTGNKPEDPSGQFPSPQYFFKENTNTQARGEERNSLSWVGYNMGTKVSDVVPSVYPYNQVSRSITGHVYEVDDTPGNERILIKHADGAGIELGVDGSVSISALGNRVEVTGGDQSITIVGDATINYQGNLDMKVNGEFNLDCNEFNVNVKNNKSEVIGGTETKEVFKGVTNSVVGNIDNFVTQKVTDTILGGHQHNVKGDYNINVNGNVGFYSSGEMNVTSEDYVNIASDNVTASANNMTIQGGNGVIGGDGVHIKGQEASFEGSVEAPTFYGNLIGKAKYAALADKALGANTAGSAPGSTGTASYPSDPGAPSFVEPTTNKVASYLTKAAGGIRKVKIDIGNYLKDFMDKSTRYDGIAAQKLSAKAVRSKLRDSANVSNRTFIGSVVEEGTLCEEYNNPTPAGIGRIVDGQSSTFEASKGASATTSTNNVIFIPRNIVKQFVPDPLYNPLNLGGEGITSITSKTKLSPKVSIARFLGTEDPVNISYIRDEQKKVEIAKHLYLQTRILETIQNNNKDFENVNLIATEGLYRPGKGETITSGSINDLKSKGRAVVYKAVVADNANDNPSKLFDIAAYLKDNAYFEQLILSYDTFECSNNLPVLTARLIITMPEIDDTFKGTFKREVFTEFNNNRLAQGELVEVLPRPRDVVVNPRNIQLSEGGEYTINLNPRFNAQTRRSNSTHPEVTVQAAKTLQLLLRENYLPMQELYGDKLLINDALPLRTTERKAPSAGGTSQHWRGKAIDISTDGMSNADKAKLVKAAVEAGFKGFGFGYTILHLDLGRKRFWAYKNTTFGGRSVDYWFKYVRQNVPE